MNPRPAIVPGQLWCWAFDVGDGSWWCQRVTERARETFDTNGTFISRGDIITIINVDDTGPHTSAYAALDNAAGAGLAHKRWHVALVRHTLVWMEDHWFDTCELLGEA